MNTILLTGGTGYIGSHCAVEFLNLGHKVIILDNFSNSSPNVIPKIEKLTNKTLYWHQVDLCNINDVISIFSLYPNISCVVHLAGLKAVAESTSNPLKYYQNNIQGLINLLLVMETFQINNFIFSSSATVYGIPEFIPLTENHKVDISCITNPYGKTKFISEQILSDVSKTNQNIKIIILRYFNPIGAHPSGYIGESSKGIPNNLLPYVTNVAVGNLKHINIYGNDYDTFDGTGVRDYIHVIDLAKGHISAYHRLLLDECKGVEIYNLGTGKGYSVLEVINEMSKTVGFSIPTIICPRRNGDIDKVYADPTLAWNKLGWKAELNLTDMCRDAWRFQKDNPDGY
jgi:UDP-glucose 4-epimerase